MKSSLTKALEKHVHRSSKIKGIYFSAQMSSAFRKRVRDAVQSSSEQKESWLNYNKHLEGQEWAMHELHEIKADLRVTFKALPKNGRGVWRQEMCLGGRLSHWRHECSCSVGDSRAP